MRLKKTFFEEIMEAPEPSFDLCSKLLKKGQSKKWARIFTKKLALEIIKHDFCFPVEWANNFLNENHINFGINSKKLFMIPLIDLNRWRMAINVALFHKNGGNTYVVAKDFLQKFKEVSINSLKFNDLPKAPFYAVIVLSEASKDLDGDLYDSFIVGIDPKQDAELSESLTRSLKRVAPVSKQYGFKSKTFLSMSYELLEHGDGVGRFFIDMPSDLDTKISDELTNMPYSLCMPISRKMGTSNIADGYLSPENKLFINLLAYINSGQPDIRAFKNTIRYKKKKMPVAKDRDLSKSDIILLGFDYKKQRNYSIDEVSVSGHFRWQRCGEGLQNVKLTWVKEHLRKFK